MTSLSVTTSIRIYKDMMLDSTVVSCVVGLSVVSGGVQQILSVSESRRPSKLDVLAHGMS